MSEARDEFGNLRCHVPGCKTVIRAFTGLQELQKLQKHMAKKHLANWNMNQALENRARIENRNTGGTAMKNLIIATSLLLLAGTASAWEKPGNPDRFISVGLSLDHDRLDGGYGPRVSDDSYMKVGEYENKIESVQFDVRVPMSDSFTVDLRVRRNSFQQRFDSQHPSLANDLTDQKGFGFGIGARYYFNR